MSVTYKMIAGRGATHPEKIGEVQHMALMAGRSDRQHAVSRARIRFTGVVLCGLLLMVSGCTSSDRQAEPVTRVMQAIDADLALNGEIRTLNGTAVFLNDESGASRSERTGYELFEVVDDLPVRVTTRYRTSEANGSNLEELVGYTGPIEIELALENLLVSSEHITYDAAGESRTSPALVGVPLSVVASTTLPGVPPSTIVSDAESERRTNGVVSAASNDGSTVQWAALLAPPQSEATVAFTLVADVQHFAAPSFHIALQTGLHSDLSFTGAMASAFTDPTAELATQQRAIDTIIEVNT